MRLKNQTKMKTLLLLLKGTHCRFAVLKRAQKSKKTRDRLEKQKQKDRLLLEERSLLLQSSKSTTTHPSSSENPELFGDALFLGGER